MDNLTELNDLIYEKTKVFCDKLDIGQNDKEKERNKS